MFKSKSGDGWYHLECFGKNKAELKFEFKPEEYELIFKFEVFVDIFLKLNQIKYNWIRLA